MRKFAAVLVVLGIVLVGIGVTASGRRSPAAAGVAAAQKTVLAFRDVRVFDGERIVPRATVVVRDGVIAAIGPDLSIPAGADVIDGDGRTLLPGFIDAHTHAFADALERALVFGVTTELDMFTDHRFAARLRAEQRSAAGAPGRADVFSAGTLVTAPNGHGTEYGLVIPTIALPADAEAFVDARLAEGSDYIKVVYEDGRSHGLKMPSISQDVLNAVVAAARARSRLAVVHVGSRQAALDAIRSGASGLVHLFADAAPTAEFVDAARRSGAFVVPTLSVIESTAAIASGAGVAKDARLARFINPSERVSLNRSFPSRPGSQRDAAHALEATRLLHDAGVPILAGSDAPNPGTAHGVTIHRELELLVKAGLTRTAALSAATSAPARAFGLKDRGRIAAGLRADLVLVTGDPAADITATRDIVGIWKGGRRVERPAAPDGTAAPRAATETGIVSTFEGSAVDAEFGAGWVVSTDSLMGGKSTATLTLIDGGARRSKGALEVAGTIVPGSPYPWAGAMFSPGPAPMAAADLSRFTEIAFWTRGDGREYQLMVFATRLGNIPATSAFTAGPEWREVVVPLKSLGGIDGSDLRGVLFSAAGAGAFTFALDDVRFR
jgi:imidazolonepropionase-like amidohydrolase